MAHRTGRGVRDVGETTSRTGMVVCVWQISTARKAGTIRCTKLAKSGGGVTETQTPPPCDRSRSAMEDTPMATHLDLNESQIDLLSELYAEADCTLDDLPYTDEFERLYAQFLARSGVSLDRHYVWKALCNARKARKLVRKER